MLEYKLTLAINISLRTLRSTIKHFSNFLNFSSSYIIAFYHFEMYWRNIGTNHQISTSTNSLPARKSTYRYWKSIKIVFFNHIIRRFSQQTGRLELMCCEILTFFLSVNYFKS